MVSIAEGIVVDAIGGWCYCAAGPHQVTRLRIEGREETIVLNCLMRVNIGERIRVMRCEEVQPEAGGAACLVPEWMQIVGNDITIVFTWYSEMPKP